MKHLYKSENNKVFAGILGGLGEYYNIDPVILRVAFVFVMIITAIIPCALAYYICSFIIPKKPAPNVRDAEFSEKTS